MFKSYEVKCEEIKRIQNKLHIAENNPNNNNNNSINLNLKSLENKKLIIEQIESEEFKNDNLSKSQANNFNFNSNDANLNISSLNKDQNLQNNYDVKTNESLIIKRLNNNNSNKIMNATNNITFANSTNKKSLGEQNEISQDNNSNLNTSTNNVNNKTFSNINNQIKTSLDFSQIKLDNDNSILLNHNNFTNKKENINNINVFKIKPNEFENPNNPQEEELINQKNTKIMLKSKHFNFNNCLSIKIKIKDLVKFI